MTYTDWILTVFLTVYVVFHWFGNGGGDTE